MDFLSQVLDNTTLTSNALVSNEITADFAGSGIVGDGKLDGTVSTQWFSRPDDERWTDANELADHLTGIKSNTEHLTMKLKDVTPVVDNGSLKFKVAGVSEMVVPTNHAFGQMSAADMYGLPQRWISSCDPDLALLNIEHGRRMSADREIKLNVLHRDGDALLRAVTSPDYGYVPDSDVMEAVLDVIGDRWTVPVAFLRPDMASEFNPVVAKNPTKEQTTLYYGDKSMCLFFVDHTTVIEAKGRKFFRGFYVLNSEVCESAIQVSTFLLDFVCMNRNIYGKTAAQVYKRKHTKYAAADFAVKVAPALKSFADGSSVGVEAAIEAADRMLIPTDADQQISLLKLYFDLGLKEGADVLDTIIAEEGHPARTAWDLVNGTTAFARRIPNADNRLVLEQAVGKFMDKAFG